MTTWLPLLLILIPALGGCLEFLTGRRVADSDAAEAVYGAGRWAVISTALSLVLALVAIFMLGSGYELAWPGGFLAADGLGLAVATMASLLGLIGLGQARRHLARDVAAGRAEAARLPMLFGCSALFVAAVNWAALNDHVILLYVAVELTTIVTILPVAFYRRRTSWEAAYKYALLNTIGLTAGLLGLAILYGAAAPVLGGQAFSLTALAAAGAELPSRAAALAGALILCGFGTKAGLVPMHAWLPDAYQESPGGFIALFAGVGTKIALVAMARALPPLMAAAPSLGTALMVVAAVSMLVGILFAFGSDNLLRMLGYSSVSQMGYIALGLSLGTAAGYTAAGYHIVSHGLLKALLFLCASEVCQAAGTARISALGGQRHPRWTGPLFLLGAVGLGGVPPLPAFWSKFQIFAATAQAGHPWAAGVAVLTSLLTITTLVWAGARIFLSHAEEGGAHGTEEGTASAAPAPWLLAALAVVVFVAGLFPGWMTELLGRCGQILMAMGV
ncbi:MAG TPA: proton-conducting transporter membrane subunit [Symbiobacteriaceae bacterium]